MDTQAYIQGFMDKLAGSKMRSLLKITNGVIHIGDTPIGHIYMDNKYPMLDSIHLEPAFRGLGLGRKVHIDTAKALPGRNLYSYSQLSPDSVRVWESMKRRYPGTVHSVTPNPVWYDSTDPLRPNLMPKTYVSDTLANAIYKFVVPVRWRR